MRIFPLRRDAGMDERHEARSPGRERRNAVVQCKGREVDSTGQLKALLVLAVRVAQGTARSLRELVRGESAESSCSYYSS